MNEFVEQCRNEWRRLGVPDPVAAEMAAEVSADLAEAEAEGTPLEQVLGPTASDARSFAADWAAARGVIAQRRRIPWSQVATAALAVIAIVGGALVLIDSPSVSKPVGGVWVAAPAEIRTVVVATPRDGPLVAPPLTPAPPEDSGATRTAGSILFFTALGAILLLTAARLRLRRHSGEPRPAD